MEKNSLIIFVVSMTSLLLAGCHRHPQETAFGERPLGKGHNSQGYWQNPLIVNPSEEEFLPLQNEDLKKQISELITPQPKHTPGEKNSPVPGIEHFQSPNSELEKLFRTVHFNTDEHVLRMQEHLATLDKIAGYLQKHPNIYLFIEGHCDQRGPEAYNLALGTRRANYVRSMLVKKGISSDRLYTISFGKEKPLDSHNNPDAWSKNRRASFKLYQQP